MAPRHAQRPGRDAIETSWGPLRGSLFAGTQADQPADTTRRVERRRLVPSTTAPPAIAMTASTARRRGWPSGAPGAFARRRSGGLGRVGHRVAGLVERDEQLVVHSAPPERRRRGRAGACRRRPTGARRRGRRVGGAARSMSSGTARRIRAAASARSGAKFVCTVAIGENPDSPPAAPQQRHLVQARPGAPGPTAARAGAPGDVDHDRVRERRERRLRAPVEEAQADGQPE